MNLYLFYLINHLPHPAWANTSAIMLHKATYGGFVYYPLFLFLYLYGNPETKRFVKILTISLISTYITTDLILKNLFTSPRPYQILHDAIYFSPAPNSYSFPSGQAAIAFALATTAYLCIPNKKWSFIAFLWALLISLDRIYMAHHFPLDVLVGGAIGVITSMLVCTYTKNLLKNT